MADARHARRACAVDAGSSCCRRCCCSGCRSSSVGRRADRPNGSCGTTAGRTRLRACPSGRTGRRGDPVPRGGVRRDRQRRAGLPGSEHLGAGPAGFGGDGVGVRRRHVVASVMLSRRASSRSRPAQLFIGGWAMSGRGHPPDRRRSRRVVRCRRRRRVSGAGNGADNVASRHADPTSGPASDAGQRSSGLDLHRAFVGGGLAYAAGGPLLDATSARTVFLIGAAGTFAVVLLATRLLPDWTQSERRKPDASDSGPGGTPR